MTKGQLDNAIRRALNLLDKWNDCMPEPGPEVDVFRGSLNGTPPIERKMG